MIRPRYNPFLIWFFNHYTRISVRSHFSKITISGEFKDSGAPVLMIGNHFSWWDGFFAHYLNMLLLNRRFNIMMLEDELKKRMFLNKIGAFSINKGSRSVIESIKLLRSLLLNKKNLVVFYPQGYFQSIYDQSITFEKGLSRILSGFEKDEIQIFFYVAMVDYLSQKKPALNFYIKKHPFDSNTDFKEVEIAYNALYRDGIENQIASV